MLLLAFGAGWLFQNMSFEEALSGALFFWLIGVFLYYAPAWFLGFIIGFLLWPFFWQAAQWLSLNTRGSAAFSAFWTAILGGVLPWGAAAYFTGLEGFGVVFASAVVSVLIGPLLALRYFRDVQIGPVAT